MSSYADASRDTVPEAAREQLRLLREAGPQGRFRAACALTDSIRALSRAGMRERMSGATEREIAVAWATQLYGERIVRSLGLADDPSR